MFGNVAEQLLKMMGMSGNPEGALRAKDVDAALTALRSALQAQAQQESESDASDTDDDSDSDTNNEAVGLATRAVPLIELLQQAKESGGYVMWRPER